MAASTISGLQKSVIATIKHFIANEQETNRNRGGPVAGISANVDDQTMHELYLAPFADAVRAGAGCVVCSCNRFNGTYACENDAALNWLLKDELAFPGFVVSDFGAQHSGSLSATNGLDLAVPPPTFWDNNGLIAAIQNGTFTESRLRDMGTRIVAAYNQIIASSPSPFPSPGIGIPPSLLSPHTPVEARVPASALNILQQAIEGHVLVKNTGNALPLKDPKILSLYGYDATLPPVNYPTTLAQSPFAYGVQAINLTLTQLAGILLGFSDVKFPDAATAGTLNTGGGSGASTGAYFSTPYAAIASRSSRPSTTTTNPPYLLHDFASLTPSVNPASTACLIFINNASSDTLVLRVASECANTIVIIHNTGIRLLDAWIDHPNVTAVVYAHLPGQASGQALAALLWGDVSPSGRLPYTVAKRAENYSDLLRPTKSTGLSDTDPSTNFTEGTLIDYASFLAKDVTPRFAFGYGLTYSTFSYAELKTSWLTDPASSISKRPPAQDPMAKAVGGNAALFAPLARVSFTLTNTGKVAAAEVPQLYVSYPGSETGVEAGVRRLKGYTKRLLQPGEKIEVVFELTRRDLSRWDVEVQDWVLQTGIYRVGVGRDVLDLPLMGTLVR